MSDFFILLFFTLVVIVLKYPVLNIPLFWDELLNYSTLSFKIVNNGFIELIKTIFSPEFYFSHPPGINIIYALGMSILGKSFITIRILSTVFTIMSIFFTYKITEKLSNKIHGVLSGLLFFFLPEVYAQSTQMIGDNALTCLMLSSIYFALTKRFFYVFCIGLIIGTCKVTGLLIIVLTLFFALNSKEKIKNSLLCLSPVYSFILYLFFLALITDSFFPDFIFTGSNIYFDLQRNFHQLISNILLSFVTFKKLNLSYLLIVIILVKGGYYFYSNRTNKNLAPLFNYKSQKSLFIISSSIFCLSFILIMSFNLGSLARYFYPIFPIFCILLTLAVRSIHKYAFILLSIISIFNFYPQYYLTNHYMPATYHQNTLEYIEVVNLHKKAFAYLEKNFGPQTIIYTQWPFNFMLSDHNYGWVKNAFSVTRNSNEYFDILIWGNNMSGQWAYKINKDKILAKYNLKLIKRFQENNKVFEIYKNNEKPSKSP